ncbi:hypothetical protein M2282_000477 [Variovorax boronicumulans]|uniref:type I restriction enzyme HsdR N-terminal domain-containing protein n=1 Tax=Variovorax boronicumulans TaxID=436515 RepID=UPI002474876F|nr:type I restriction enzyme HsdR N-terminal domain-containing protein [Variovorax boronicumulans]MDH6165349.1 hypothetical protein [Variovorax boronicumulans]
MNEEEIKIKYILPWLEDAGVGVDELQFERTFSVRVGKQVFQTPRSKETVTGRLDILVRRNEKNLFIVETKAGHLALTDDDRDQAISYARLVQPLAPYALVTNGSDFKLYDSLTKKEIEPSTIKIRGFEAVLPNEDIEEAQRVFLKLNSANLTMFCQGQVASETLLIKGNVASGKKYVPELHVSRANILEEVENFYKSTLPGLMLLGESGLGKTCELCSIVDSLLANERPVLFFNGFSLDGDVLGAVAREFSWTFNGGDSPIQVIKRIEACLAEVPLTIVIDAIDEWRLESKVNHLAAVLKAIQHRKIKLIVSCKTSAANAFLFQRGNRTAISFLTKPLNIIAFSPPEFFNALENYRETYKFFGGFEDAVLDQARNNPFLLRVLFDVAQDSGVEYLSFDSAEFFSAYYKRSIEKTVDAQQAENTLKNLARLLYEGDKEWIFEDEVRSALNLRVNERLMDELFEYGVLLRSFEDSGESAISFYFQQFRDYIVGFKAIQFDKMDETSLMAELRATSFPGTRGASLTLYYRLATTDRKRIFDSKLRAKALKYLEHYVSLKDENFPALEEKLPPYENGRIGFIGELMLANLQSGLYGFRLLGRGDEEIYFMPVEEVAEKSNIKSLAGAGIMHSVGYGLNVLDNFDMEGAIKKDELISPIRELIKDGRLNETENFELNCEKIVQAIYENKKLFKPLFGTDGRSINYPLQFDSVLACIAREELTRSFKDDLVKQKRKVGEIREFIDADVVTFSYILSASDIEAIARRVDEALQKNEMPPIRSRYIELEQLKAIILESTVALRKTCSRIEADPPTIAANQLVEKRAPIVLSEWKEVLVGMYTSFLYNYRALVEKNFPTLRSNFKLYSEGPVALFLVVEGRFGFEQDYGSMGLNVYFSRSKTGSDSVRIVEKVVQSNAKNGVNFVVDGVEHEGFHWNRTSVWHVFHSAPRASSSSFRGMSLRGLVYSKIWDELPAVEAAFCA